ncbi:MAG TPA: hypothetical protein VJN92_05595 [Candidatus Acidoferrum sp.]|nr:hypothetical protein [Candidatus Acidoferrum sp.]
MSWKDALWAVGSAGVALLGISLFTSNGSVFKRSPREQPAIWNQPTINAGYIGSQLREIDKTRASLVISYDLENNTDSDFRLADGPNVVILSRLKSDGSYSQEQPIRLSYPVFLPARQHARLAVEITQPFNWPSDADSGAIEKLRSFVRRRLQNVGQFVLFDEANHRQLELPSGWDQLGEMSEKSD